MDSDIPKQKKSIWADVGAVYEFPAGKMKKIDLFDKKILITMVDGIPLAVADTCTHEDASLSTGHLRGDRVKCPLHGSWFCLRDGKPLDEPAEETLECFDTRLASDRIEIRIKY